MLILLYVKESAAGINQLRGKRKAKSAKGKTGFFLKYCFLIWASTGRCRPQSGQIKSEQTLQVSLPIQVILICDKLALIPSFYVPSTDPDQYDFP